MGYDYSAIWIESLRTRINKYIIQESRRLINHYKYMHKHWSSRSWDIYEKIDTQGHLEEKDVINAYFEGFAHLRIPTEFKLYYKEMGYKSQSCMIEDIHAKIVADASYGMTHYILMHT